MENFVATAFETIGLGAFFFYLIKGLKAKIGALESVVVAQVKTLDVMEKRNSETEKIGEIYKNLISDLPDAIDNYKSIISKTKDETIIELTNLHEDTKNKLEESEKMIKNSKNTKEIIGTHLNVLKNMLANPGGAPGNARTATSDIAQLCQFGGREIDKCVPLIVESKTFEEFIKKAGYSLKVTEDDSVAKQVFNHGKDINGDPVQDAFATHNASGGSFVVVNNNIYANNISHKNFKNEFSSIKLVP